jgi:hypothetical protein
VGESKLKHYTCSNGAEFVISTDAEQVTAESSEWLRKYMADSAKDSNGQVIFTITDLPDGMLMFQFKPRAEVLGDK